MYRELDPARIMATAEALSRRILERFPDSGLGRVSRELLSVARESDERIAELRRPHWPLRALAGAGVLVLLAVIASGVMAVRVRTDAALWSDALQGLEAAINDVIFLGLAVFFLSTLETRLKRRRALRGLHELRSLAHIVDMHQLTKDPESLVTPGMATTSSPPREMSRFELVRYLDYCSELLSMTSKLAALYAQYFNDPVVLNAVNDVQSLSYGLSGKIWQKIMILDTVGASEQPSSPA